MSEDKEKLPLASVAGSQPKFTGVQLENGRFLVGTEISHEPILAYELDPIRDAAFIKELLEPRYSGPPMKTLIQAALERKK